MPDTRYKMVNGARIEMSKEEAIAWEDEVLGMAPPPVPQTLSFAQLLIGLVAEGWITEAEGDAWANRQLPAAVNTLIAGLPQAQRFAARARAKLPSVVLRNDALVVALATQQGKSPGQLDDFFRKYAEV